MISPGSILPGLTVVDSPGPDANDMVYAGAGTHPGVSKAILSRAFNDSTDLIFAPGTPAAGFDFAAAIGAGVLNFGSFTISAYGASGFLGRGFTLTGTAGQPDASAANELAGGNYALTGGFWASTPALCTEFATADFDQDCDVDEDDFTAFAACAAGPDVGLGPRCEDKDLDGDTDADSDDFAVFQLCISGANQPADPNCAL
ncbi:MAG: hypothetical protein HY718_14400 [Planctomycetes bacterium]|nr:hypothetical protein [Planctomycetota bacterium]